MDCFNHLNEEKMVSDKLGGNYGKATFKSR